MEIYRLFELIPYISVNIFDHVGMFPGLYHD